MEKSFFFNAVVTDGVADRTYSAEDIAEREALLISDGVIGGDSLEIEAVFGGGVYMSPGGASIAGYTYLNGDVTYIPLEAADSEYDRIDTVALKLDLTARTVAVTAVKGVAAAIPAAPALTDTDTVKYLPLADVRVPVGQTSRITSDDVTDRRVLASYLGEKENMTAVIREYLGALDPVNSAEMAQLRKLIDTVSTAEGSDTVLCGDGVYRKYGSPSRTVAAVFDTPGTYEFDPAEYSSVNGLYDIEVQGAGGGGGCHNGVGTRGGGGGGGAYIIAANLSLAGAVEVTVGGGGEGVPGGSGENGEDSSFDGFTAEGGKGGLGGNLAGGGVGGAGMYTGGSGRDGDVGTTDFGMGGRSRYGDGAKSAAGTGAAPGVDAVNPGSGGSGGTAVLGTFSYGGGKGGDGIVTVYRYTYGEEAES